MRSVRLVWSINLPATEISTETARAKKGAQTMARRKLTLEQQLKGVTAALRSPRTPPTTATRAQERAEDLKRQLRGAGTQTREGSEGFDVMSLLDLR
jgi:hypothetical protein